MNYRKSRIIIDAAGQTCNRFWSYLESVSWAILNKKRVIILYWDSSLKYYTALRKNEYVLFPFWNNFLIKQLGHARYQRLVRKIVNSIPIERIFSGCELIKGWDIRECDVFYPQVKDIANKLFLPDKHIVDEVDGLFSRRREDSNIIVGIHIRRGDYKTWKGGVFYYDDNVYESYMCQIENMFPYKHVLFFISTNDSISEIVSTKHKTFRIKNATVAHDLYGLTLCDFILGPPSTFSKWASLVGNVPLHHIYSSSEILTIQSFSPLISHRRFANGIYSEL